MLKNFILVAFRNLWKQRFYAFINISGLAVGLACCILIVLFVRDELTYDQQHSKADRIYRVYADLKFGEMDGRMTYLPAPLAPTLKEEFPEVEMAARLRNRGGYLVRRTDETDNVREESFIFADPEIFEIFDFPAIQGDPVEGLKEPQTMVISEQAAQRFFKDENPVGQTLILNNDQKYRIVAVIEDIPNNNHFARDFFLSMVGLEEAKNQIWLSHNFHTYLLLKEGVKPESVQAKFEDLLDRKAGPQLKQFMGSSMEDWEAEGNRIGYYLQALPDIHLYSKGIDGMGGEGSIETVNIFSIIALVILLIAIINFTNLATARSAKRAREVGVRKVLGSHKGQLIWQFIIESVMLSFLAMVLAIGLSYALLPFFNELSSKGLSLPWLEPFFAPALLLGTLLIGILAGVYPAFFLSSFRPVEVLKSRFTAKKGGKFLRSALVVGQFTASIALVIFTIVIQQQMNYVQNKNLGYDREQVLILEDAYTLGEKSESFKNEMLQLPEISEVSMSAFLPTWSSRNNNAHWPKGKRNEESTVIIQNWSVDHDYIPTLGMEIIRGRNFDRKMATDSQAVILNETAVRQLGFTDNPIGQYISTFIDIDDQTGETTEGDYKVIGVIKDFHFSTLRNTISALGLFMRDEPAYYFIFRTETSDLESTLATMEKKWKEFNPGQPFNYSFLDERFDQMYRSVSREGRVFGAFAFLAILVACLGLFALAAYMAETRYKEIGIRKVMGASVSNIVLLLSREFMQLVGIALLLAIPLSWLLASQWLEDFAYRISINAWTFVIAAALAIGIALLTVSYQSFKAAMADPVNALKDE